MSALPPELLVKLFQTLELPSLLDVGEVCHDWRAAQLTVCADFRVLQLSIGEGADVLRKSDQSRFMLPYEQVPTSRFEPHRRIYYHCDSLDQKIIAKIGVLLLNITELEITIDLPSINAIVTLVQLIFYWHKQLIRLKLSIRNSLELPTGDELSELQSAIDCLLEQLSDLDALRHFTLICHNRITNLNMQRIILLIEHLDEFWFHSLNSEVVLNALIHFADAGDSRLCLHGLNGWWDIPVQPGIISRLVQLNFNHRIELSLGENGSLLGLLESGLFSSLTWLSARLGARLPLIHFVSYLTNLPNLTHLTLGINFRIVQRQPHSNNQNIIPLFQLKVLTLDVITKCQADLDKIPFGCLFPHLEIFALIDRQLSTAERDQCHWPLPEPSFQNSFDIIPLVWEQFCFLPAASQLENEELENYQWHKLSRIVERWEPPLPLAKHQLKIQEKVLEPEIDEERPPPELPDPPLNPNLRGIGHLLLQMNRRHQMNHDIEAVGRHINLGNLALQGVLPILAGQEFDADEDGPIIVRLLPAQFYQNPRRRAAFVRRYLGPLVQCWQLKHIFVHEANAATGWNISAEPRHSFTLSDI